MLYNSSGFLLFSLIDLMDFSVYAGLMCITQKVLCFHANFLSVTPKVIYFPLSYFWGLFVCFLLRSSGNAVKFTRNEI